MKVKKKMLKVREIFPSNGGIFGKIQIHIPRVNVDELDRLFYSLYGNKTVSPIVIVIKGDNEPTELTRDQLARLALMFYDYYKKNWEHLSALWYIEYDPIHNYLDEWNDKSNESENSNRTSDTTRTDSINSTDISSKTRTDNLNENTTKSYTDSNSQTDGKWGFNASVNSKPTDTSSGSTSGNSTDVTSNTGTQNTEQTDTTTAENVRDYSEETDDVRTDEIVRSGKHFGNIGNLTTQTMINQEKELWQWSLMQEMLDDAKEFFTIPVYID